MQKQFILNFRVLNFPLTIDYENKHATKIFSPFMVSVLAKARAPAELLFKAVFFLIEIYHHDTWENVVFV